MTWYDLVPPLAPLHQFRSTTGGGKPRPYSSKQIYLLP